MAFRALTGWEDCRRLLPYRDYNGRLVLLPTHTQRRRVARDGMDEWEYRERGETDEELLDRQW